MTATATRTRIVRLDHVDVPVDAVFDAHFPPSSDERYAQTLEMARRQGARRRAAKLRAEEQARAEARQVARDAANAEARARMGAGLHDYVFGDDFR